MGEELPEGWAWARVDEICAKVQDGTHFSPKEQSSHGAFKYITAKNIKVWGLDFTELTYVSETVHREIYSRCNPEKGDILYIKDGATTGIATVNELDEEFSLLSSVALLKPHRSCLDSRFLKWYLNSPVGFDRMTGQMTGCAITRIILKTIRQSIVPLAPLAEQQRIVAAVEALLARVQVARARLAKVPALLKRFRQSVLAAACSGELSEDWREKSGNGPVAPDYKLLSEPDAGLVDVADLTELPRVWGLAPLDDLRDVNRSISYGVLKPGPYVDDGIPLLRILDILSGSADTKDVHRIAPELSDQYRRTVLHGGEVLVSLVGTIGRVAIVPEALEGANVHRNLAVVPPAPNVVGKYLYYALRAPPVQRQIEHLTTGANQPLFNLGDLRRLAIPVPSLDEQHEIVRRVDALFALADKIEARVSAATARVEKITQAILAKAFRGELVPTEAELARQEGRDYEPASVLLERIRAERTAGADHPAARHKRPKSPNRP